MKKTLKLLACFFVIMVFVSWGERAFGDWREKTVKQEMEDLAAKDGGSVSGAEREISPPKQGEKGLYGVISNVMSDIADIPERTAAPTEALALVNPAETSGGGNERADEPRQTESAVVETDSPAKTEEPTTVDAETPAPSETPAATEQPEAPETSTAEAPVVIEPVYTEKPSVNLAALSNKKQSWSYAKAKNGARPAAYTEFDVTVYGGRYLGAEGTNGKKSIYLTFDEGYENGFTPSILDTLKEKGVKATFFVTMPFIDKNPDLVRRMADEGHAVCSHSVKHLPSPDLTDEELVFEIEEPARAYLAVTGKSMVKCFRPPEGVYSERTLAVAQDIGWKSVFWSFAHRDWVVDDQPTKEETFDKITGGAHDGAIILLHAVSEANTAALGGVIDALTEQGYTFKGIEQLN